MKLSRIAIIGCGHNALICSTTLSQAGCTVDVFEARANPGGALDVLRADCGCQINRYANQLRLFDQAAIEIVSRAAEYDLSACLLVPEVQAKLSIGKAQILIHSGDTIDSIAEKASAFEPRDNTVRYLRDLERASSLVRDLWIGPHSDRTEFIRRLEIENPKYVDAFINGSLCSTANMYFQSELAKILFVLSQSLITSDPHDAGSAFCLLYQDSGNTSFAPNYAIPRFGMRSLADQFSKAAQRSGATLFLGRAADTIEVVGDEIRSVTMKDGSVLSSYEHYVFGFSPAIVQRMISSNQAGQDERHLQSYETGGVKVFVTLDRTPQNWERVSADNSPFHCLYAEGDGFQRASTSARGSTEFHPAFVEVMIDELAGYSPECASHIALSIYSGFYPYDALNSASKAMANIEISRNVIDAISSYFGILSREFRVHSVETSLDFERDLGMYRGDVDHGSFSFGNQFEARGRMSIANEDRLRNYWNCSAGAFPGGLITGRPGIACASRILEAIGRG